MLSGSRRSTAIVAAMALAVGGCGQVSQATGHSVAGHQVKMSVGSREILTGAFQLKGPSPQQRPDEFKPVKYPAVTIENEYLRCCVLPTVGGRLYDVYNKVSKSHVFFVNPYLETHPDDYEGGHPWNLGGVEVNFPYFHHGNTYNDRWQWAEVRRDDGTAGVTMAFTSRPTMQRAVFRVLLRPGVARVELEYRFENLNPYPWGLAAWIDTMHPKTMDTEFILPSPWVAGHGYNLHRTTLYPWPVRGGVDLSWQKNVPPGGDLSEFAFMPRLHFHGCYDHKADRGAVRLFNPETLPAAKLWTQAAPVKPEQYYQHFEIWTATSAVMEDPGRQDELSAYEAADSWQQVWGIGGYVYANEDLALNLVRQGGGKLLAGVCGTRRIPNCTVSLRRGLDAFWRVPLDLDPAKPWKAEPADPGGDLVMEVTGPDGRSLARYELLAGDVPREAWKMPEKPRWAEGLNAAIHEESYSTLWRRRGHFLDGAIGRYEALLKADPGSAAREVDLARAYLKDAQVRQGSAYPEPGPKADADAATRSQADLSKAAELLREALKRDPENGRARLYLGLALERQGRATEALDAYRAAAGCPSPAWAAEVYLARALLEDRPREALAAAQRAAEMYPQSSRAKHVWMAALLADGKAEEAVALGKRLLEVDAANLLTVRLLIDACSQAGDDAGAAAQVKEAQRLLADDPTAKAGLEADLRWLYAK